MRARYVSDVRKCRRNIRGDAIQRRVGERVQSGPKCAAGTGKFTQVAGVGYHKAVGCDGFARHGFFVNFGLYKVDVVIG